jgi:hypothetical protein
MSELEEIEELEEDGEVQWVYVCHGPPRCEEDINEGECDFCYRFRADDGRTIEQIRADMKREQ